MVGTKSPRVASWATLPFVERKSLNSEGRHDLPGLFKDNTILAETNFFIYFQRTNWVFKSSKQVFTACNVGLWSLINSTWLSHFQDYSKLSSAVPYLSQLAFVSLLLYDQLKPI